MVDQSSSGGNSQKNQQQQATFLTNANLDAAAAAALAVNQNHRVPLPPLQDLTKSPFSSNSTSSSISSSSSSNSSSNQHQQQQQQQQSPLKLVNSQQANLFIDTSSKTFNDIINNSNNTGAQFPFSLLPQINNPPPLPPTQSNSANNSANNINTNSQTVEKNQNNIASLGRLVMSNLGDMNQFAAAAAFQQNMLASLLQQQQFQQVSSPVKAPLFPLNSSEMFDSSNVFAPGLMTTLLQQQQQQQQKNLLHSNQANSLLTNAFQNMQNNTNRDYLLTSAFASLQQHQQQQFLLRSLANGAGGVGPTALNLANPSGGGGDLAVSLKLASLLGAEKKAAVDESVESAKSVADKINNETAPGNENGENGSEEAGIDSSKTKLNSPASLGSSICDE
jgi:hypothetical protein